MFAGSIQWAIISLMLIILVHYLYSFFINTLTVPKVRDMINKPNQRYSEIVSEATANARAPRPENAVVETASAMEDELKSFLQDLKHKPQSNNGDPTTTSTLAFSSL